MVQRSRHCMELAKPLSGFDAGTARIAHASESGSMVGTAFAAAAFVREGYSVTSLGVGAC